LADVKKMVRHNNPDTRTHWRDFLRGTYTITEKRTQSKMRHDVRKRATRLMEDLLLICQSPYLSKPDKDLIFRNLNEWTNMPEKDRMDAKRIAKPTTIWQNVTNPLVRELMHKAAVLTNETKDVEKIQELYLLFEFYGEKYDLKCDLNRLISDPQYRGMKMQQVEGTPGLKTILDARKSAQNLLQIESLPQSDSNIELGK
jgi:hypothetical protein